MRPISESAPRSRTALFTVAAVGVVLAVLLGVLFTRERRSDADSPLIGRPAPPTAGASLLDGDDFDLGDEAGRFVLVNFFATWCEPCKAEHDDLLQFANRHLVADDARVVSVVYGDRAVDVQDFFERRGGDWAVIDDPEGRLALDWGVVKVPESYLVGPEGVVRAKFAGGIRLEELEDVLLRAKGT